MIVMASIFQFIHPSTQQTCALNLFSSPIGCYLNWINLILKAFKTKCQSSRVTKFSKYVPSARWEVTSKTISPTCRCNLKDLEKLLQKKMYHFWTLNVIQFHNNLICFTVTLKNASVRSESSLGFKSDFISTAASKAAFHAQMRSSGFGLFGFQRVNRGLNYRLYLCKKSIEHTGEFSLYGVHGNRSAQKQFLSLFSALLEITAKLSGQRWLCVYRVSFVVPCPTFSSALHL